MKTTPAMQKIILSYFLIINTTILAQNDSIPIGKVVYLHQIHLETNNAFNGTATLLFNGTNSIYIHNDAPKANTSIPGQSGIMVTLDGDSGGFPIYKQHLARKIISKIPCRQSSKHCLVVDTLGAIDWKIDPQEHRRIGAYDCRKATGVFAGREYEAWFTLEIPISSGPQKLGGLPGLILEARTTDGKVEYLFSSLEISPRITETIHPPTGYETDMTYAEYIRERNAFHRQLVKQFQAKGMDVSITPITDTIELVPDE